MSDIILYAAIKENQKLNTELLELCISSGITESFYFTPDEQLGYPHRVANSSNTVINPLISEQWQEILTPLVEVNQSNGFKVCDTTTEKRCNAYCAWTVPAGVSRAQFQIWGPGSGTSSTCCCGGSTMGVTGAYMVVTMDVTPGDIYDLCGGCAYCCFASQTTPGICGSPSWVMGPGLCMCAESGVSCIQYWAEDITATSGANQLPTFDGCGAQSCSGWNFCWDNATDRGIVCHAFSRSSWYMNCCDPARNPVCYGLNGIYPSYVMFYNFCGCSKTGPVFGYENCACTLPWCGSTCGGCCYRANQGIMQIPGAGGYGATVTSGNNASTYTGDSGRMGMVCVSWEC